MYCSACGQPMDPYQPYCARCGRQVTAIPTAPLPPWTWSRVHRHVHTLGILWIAYAGWTLLHWVMVVPFLSGMAQGWFPFHRGFDGFVFPFENMPWFIPMITVILAGRAILCAGDRVRPAAAVSLGPDAGDCDRHPDPDPADHRDGSGDLHPLGSAARRLGAGI